MPYPRMNREHYISHLAKGECEIIFEKTDGSTRHMVCTNNPELIPDEKLPKLVEGKEARKINEDVVPCFDLTIGEWRSFRVDSVIDFVPQ